MLRLLRVRLALLDQYLVSLGACFVPSHMSLSTSPLATPADHWGAHGRPHTLAPALPAAGHQAAAQASLAKLWPGLVERRRRAAVSSCAGSMHVRMCTACPLPPAPSSQPCRAVLCCATSASRDGYAALSGRLRGLQWDLGRGFDTQLQLGPQEVGGRAAFFFF